MSIPELENVNYPLHLIALNNVYTAKDKNEPYKQNHYVNCVFEKREQVNGKYQSTTEVKKILSTYWPELIPGSIWKNGINTNRFNSRFTLKFKVPAKKYKAKELEDHLKFPYLFHYFLENKSFYYLPKNEIEIIENGVSLDGYEGVIIPLSAIASYYFINSDNMLYEIFYSAGAAFKSFDPEKSRELTESLNSRCIWLDRSTPIHDAAFWSRILHEKKFYSCFIKMKNDYYVETVKSNPQKNIFSKAQIESDFPFEDNIQINAFCRKRINSSTDPKNNYLLLDNITYHDAEWINNIGFKFKREERGHFSPNIDFSKLKNLGSLLLKPYQISSNYNMVNSYGYDPSMKKIKKFIKNNEREEPIPKPTRIPKTDQEGYFTTIAINKGLIDKSTANPNVETNSNIPKIDIVGSNPRNKLNEKDGLNSIEKLAVVKEYLASLEEIIECRFSTPFPDPFNDHPDYISIFPPANELKSFYYSRSNDEFKFVSKRKVPRHSPIIGRRPPTGYGVLLRGVAILEIRTLRGYFYIIEIEPTGDEQQREFRTFIVNINNFHPMNYSDTENLLKIIVKCKGIYNEEIFAKSIFEVKAKKVSPDRPSFLFAYDIIDWIDEIK